jgi:itaconate CoA-transferase
MDTQIVVTEFGWTNLKGKSSTERAQALILAHPEFQAGLATAAKEMHLV